MKPEDLWRYSKSFNFFFSFKDNGTKKRIDKFLAYEVEEGERLHKLQRDQESDKMGERRHREKKEHSVRSGKERLSKERSHKRYEEEEKHESKRSKEGSSYGDREGQLAEANERVKSRENERKKRDLRVSFVKTLKHDLITCFNCWYTIIGNVNNKNTRIVSQHIF